MTGVAPAPNWREQIAADTAAHQNELAGAAHHARRVYAQQNPERAQELRHAFDVAQSARQEAQQAAAALEAHKRTPPTSREGLEAWKERAISLTAEAEGLRLLAEQAERRANDLRRIFDQAVGALVLREIDATRARAAALHRQRGREIAELLAKLHEAQGQADRELAALLDRELAHWEAAAVAMELEHFPGWAWRDKLRTGRA